MIKTKYSLGFKQQVIKRAEESSIREAAAEFNIPSHVVHWWMNRKEQDTKEIDNAEDATAKEINNEQAENIASEQENIETVKAEGSKRIVRYSDELKQQILNRADEVGTKAAAEEFNVAPQSINSWQRSGKYSTESPKKSRGNRYNDEFKAEVLARTEEIGISKAAREYNVAPGSIRIWKRNADKVEKKTETSLETTIAEELKQKSRSDAADTDIVDKMNPTEPTSEAPVKEAVTDEMLAHEDKSVKQSIKESKTETVVKKISSSLEIENSVLKAENESLKVQLRKLKKALAELI